MAKLVDVLAVLCRKNFGGVFVRVARSGAVVTLRTYYEAEEGRVQGGKETPGDFSSAIDDGLLVIRRKGEKCPLFVPVLTEVT